LRPGLDMRKDEKSPRSARWVGTVSSMVKVPHWVPTDSWVSAARVDWKMIELQLQAFKHLQTTSNETQECVEGWQAVTSGLQGLGIGKATMCSGFDPKVWAHVKWWYVLYIYIHIHIIYSTSLQHQYNQWYGVGYKHLWIVRIRTQTSRGPTAIVQKNERRTTLRCTNHNKRNTEATILAEHAKLFVMPPVQL
jgi:hypothetical protein